ncbi:MAG: RNA-binding S4 domain-containing protein [Caldicoprobacter sp.]|uniref:RNA-binding S4 domain-containing protein n=1 Tax=Caldicoprobacter sp. TaxID=2004500 RepID=UPI001D9C792A|nr:RNA-binding protein [Clostridia bacterium]
MREIKIHTQYIKLTQFLKWANIAITGSEANQMIRNGMVSVNGQVELRRGRKLYPGDCVEVEGAGIYRIIGGGNTEGVSKGTDPE